MPTIAEYSEVSICNLALAEIGRGAQITSLGEASQAARICKLRYPYARDAVLRAYDWNFAARRAELARNVITPSFEFSGAFDLPDDCLLVRAVQGEHAQAWVVEGNQILSNASAPLFIKYTALITNPASFDTLFSQALASRLASDIAVQLSESVARAQTLWQSYQAKLSEAIARDAEEGFARGGVRTDWLDARCDPGFVPSRPW